MERATQINTGTNKDGSHLPSHTFKVDRTWTPHKPLKAKPSEEWQVPSFLNGHFLDVDKGLRKNALLEIRQDNIA